jgi:hypothetical protein
MKTIKNYIVFSKATASKSGTIKSIAKFSTRDAARMYKRTNGGLRKWGIYSVISNSVVR